MAILMQTYLQLLSTMARNSPRDLQHYFSCGVLLLFMNAMNRYPFNFSIIGSHGHQFFGKRFEQGSSGKSGDVTLAFEFALAPRGLLHLRHRAPVGI